MHGSIRAEPTQGDIIISHYGLESGLIYKQGRALRQQVKYAQPMRLTLDLLPDQSIEQLAKEIAAFEEAVFNQCLA